MSKMNTITRMHIIPMTDGSTRGFTGPRIPAIPKLFKMGLRKFSIFFFICYLSMKILLCKYKRMFTQFILMLFFTGIIFVVTNELTYDRHKEIQYRYLPRDLDEFIRTEPYPSAIFGSMWEVDVRRGGDGMTNPPGIRQSN